MSKYSNPVFEFVFVQIKMLDFPSSIHRLALGGFLKKTRSGTIFSPFFYQEAATSARPRKPLNPVFSSQRGEFNLNLKFPPSVFESRTWKMLLEPKVPFSSSLTLSLSRFSLYDDWWGEGYLTVLLQLHDVVYIWFW